MNRLGVNVNELDSLYEKVKELFMLEFGSLLNGTHIDSSALVTAIHKEILREDKKGDELVLYFLEKGDTCAMTFSCCLS